MVRTALAMLLLLFGHPRVGAQSEPLRHEPTPPKPQVLQAQINGAGSTTINVRFSAWINEYQGFHPGIRISYQPIGSSGGVRQFIERNISFAATDVPMTNEQIAKAGVRVLQLPVALTAVVPLYNLAQVSKLQLSGTTLADILLGKITKWSDPAIAADNPGGNLPATEIKIFPTFATGTTAVHVMADYLSKVSPTFKAAPTNSSGWPEFHSTYYHYKGAEGTEAFVATTPGAFGFGWQHPYSENMRSAAVKNSDGEFLTASPESIAAAGVSALSGLQNQEPDFRISITNAPGKTAYPVASFIWLILPDEDGRPENVALTDFVKWILTEGQKSALKLGYGALPEALVQAELKQVR